MTHACRVQFFSNCSRRSIVKRLKSKAPSCFRKRNINVCGNSRVEPGEDCDPGLLHINSDSCCTPDCRLRAGAQCRRVAARLGLMWGRDDVSHDAAVRLGLVTGTARVVRTACSSLKGRFVRNPWMPPVKDTPTVQVSVAVASRRRTAEA